MKRFLMTAFCILLLLTGFTACGGDESHASSQKESVSETPVPTICEHVGGEWVVKTAPTCTEKGLCYQLCTLCGNMIEAELISALGHAFTAYTPNGDATCRADGTKTAACDRDCGATETVADEGTALGHSFTEYASNGDATCLADGTKTAACANGCGATETVADEGSMKLHTYQWIIGKAATCENAGEMHCVCEACGVVLNRIPLSATGHVYGLPTSDRNGRHVQSCLTCGATLATDCIYVFVSSTDATCTVPQRMTYMCTVCGHTHTEDVGDPDFSLHVFAETMIREATCTVSGIGKLVCACGENNGYFYVPAAHTWGDVTVITPATCDKEGVGVRVCTVCDSEEECELAANGHSCGTAVSDQNGKHTAVCSVCSAVVTEKCTYVADGMRDATCSSVAQIRYSCSHCGDFYWENSGTILKPNQHLWENVVIKAPTCTSSGIGKRVCSACGKVKEYFSIPAAHRWDDAGEFCIACGIPRPSDEE